MAKNKVDLNNRIENAEAFSEMIRRAHTLRARKFSDYGPCYRDFGLLGICIKMNDKMARIKNLIENKSKVKSETIVDTAVDLANYAIMFAMEVENAHDKR